MNGAVFVIVFEELVAKSNDEIQSEMDEQNNESIVEMIY